MKINRESINIFVIVAFTVLTFAILLIGVLSFSNLLKLSGNEPLNSLGVNYGVKYSNVFLVLILANYILAIIASFLIKNENMKAFYMAFKALGVIVILFILFYLIPTNERVTYNLGGYIYTIPVTYNPKFRPYQREYIGEEHIEIMASYPTFEPIFKKDLNSNRSDLMMIRLYKDTKFFHDLFKGDYFKDELTAITEDMNINPPGREIKTVLSKNNREKYYYKLNESGQIVLLGDCYSTSSKCHLRFIDNKFSYDVMYRDDIDLTEDWESTEKKIIMLFEQLCNN